MSCHVVRMGNQRGRGVILCLPPNGGSTAMSRHVVRMGNQRGCSVILCLPPNGVSTAMSRHVVRGTRGAVVLYYVSLQTVGVLQYPVMW